MAVAPASSSEVYELLRQSGIHTPDRLAALIPNPAALPPDPQKALGVLVSKGVLTRFQAEQIIQGRHRGFRMGSYVVQSILGRGGMGAVYLGEHQELRRKVAIKVLVPGKDSDHNLAIERFLREARAAAALDHPNIVRIHDVCRSAEVPYLVMEYVEGETLQQILDRDGAISHGTAADYIAQAASGLQHAYEKEFIHRDIKPANLMRDRDGTVKILDMGLARSSIDPGDQLTERLDHGAVVGTADFIAPEQAMDSAHADIRADIYSLGATFYALVTGKPPFDGNTAQKLLKHQVADVPEVSAFDESLPEELSEIIATMMAKRPEDRYQTPGEVIAALAPWVGGSSRVIAGVSKTNAGNSGELQATIDSVASRHGSSGRVGRRKGDSGTVNPGRPERDTDSFAASLTTRDATRRLTKKLPAAAKKNKAAILGTAAAVLVAVGAIGWVAFGGSSKPGETADANKGGVAEELKVAANTTPLTPVQPKPKTETPPPPVVPAGPAEKVLYKLDLTRQKSFAIRSRQSESKDDPPKVTYPVLSKTGTGQPPAGWVGRVWNKDTRMEFFSDAAAGVPAVGIRNTQGPAAAMMFTPTFQCPTGACRLKFDYSANVRQKVGVRFKPPEGQAWDVTLLPGTGTAWRVENVVVDLKGATSGFFEFHNTDESPDAAFRLRSLVVTEVTGPGVTPPTPTPTPPPATSTPTAGTLVYKLDTAGVPLFRTRKEWSKYVGGDNAKLPAGITSGCWKRDATGEFRCEVIDGAKALGITNLTDAKSAQYGFELEKALGATLTPGKAYQVTVNYLTRNDAGGWLSVQTADTKPVASSPLRNTADKWVSATVPFTRGDQPVRFTLENTTIGEGNILLLRGLEVREAGGPAAVAPATPAGPREIGAVYDVSFDGVSPFRKTVEKGKSSVGGAEKLPPHVSGFCWAEGATAEFRAEVTDGAKAVGFTNLTDKKSAQLMIAFENVPGSGLIAGKTYKVRVTYRTANQATGRVAIQGPGPDYKKLVTTQLADSGGKWKTAEGTFTRGDDVVTVTIDNTAVGEGNTLSVRTVEIVELDTRGQ